MKNPPGQREAEKDGNDAFLFVHDLTRVEPATQYSHHEVTKDTKKRRVIKNFVLFVPSWWNNLFFVAVVGL